MDEGRNIFVCGRTGTGKSYLVKRLIAESRPLLVYLPKREELDYPGIVFDGLEDEPWGFWEFWGRCVAITPGCWRIVFRPRDVFDYDTFDRVCQAAYACGNLTFVCEDLMTYVGPHVTNLGSGFKTLLTAGRTRGIICYLLTQRPYKIPREVTSQTREAFIFQSHEPADGAYVKEAFGIDAAERMAALQEYEYVHWTDNGHVEVGKA
mgnify:FL=1